jgi:hypothetical protein
VDRDIGPLTSPAEALRSDAVVPLRAQANCGRTPCSDARVRARQPAPDQPRCRGSPPAAYCNGKA